MPFLTLNNLTISAEDESVSESFTDYGEQARAFLNRPKRHRKGITKSISLTSCLLPEADADSLVGFVEGRGNHFGFEADAWSEEGLGPEAGATYTITAGGYVGSNRLVLTSSNIVYNPEFRDFKWTVCYARTSDSGSTWQFVTVRRDGAKWIDGVRDDAASTAELTVSNGAVALSNVFDYDELIILPFLISETHAVELYGWVSAGNAFTVRRLTMKGDILGNTTREQIVIGEVDGQKYLQGNKNATWLNNLRTVDFTLAVVELI
jgi:hypothetical protein